MAMTEIMEVDVFASYKVAVAKYEQNSKIAMERWNKLQSKLELWDKECKEFEAIGQRYWRKLKETDNNVILPTDICTSKSNEVEADANKSKSQNLDFVINKISSKKNSSYRGKQDTMLSASPYISMIDGAAQTSFPDETFNHSFDENTINDKIDSRVLVDAFPVNQEDGILTSTILKYDHSVQTSFKTMNSSSLEDIDATELSLDKNEQGSVHNYTEARKLSLEITNERNIVDSVLEDGETKDSVVGEHDVMDKDLVVKAKEVAILEDGELPCSPQKNDNSSITPYNNITLFNETKLGTPVANQQTIDQSSVIDNLTTPMDDVLQVPQETKQSYQKAEEICKKTSFFCTPLSTLPGGSMNMTDGYSNFINPNDTALNADLIKKARENQIEYELDFINPNDTNPSTATQKQRQQLKIVHRKPPKDLPVLAADAMDDKDFFEIAVEHSQHTPSNKSVDFKILSNSNSVVLLGEHKPFLDDQGCEGSCRVPHGTDTKTLKDLPKKLEVLFVNETFVANNCDDVVDKGTGTFDLDSEGNVDASPIESGEQKSLVSDLILERQPVVAKVLQTRATKKRTAPKRVSRKRRQPLCMPKRGKDRKKGIADCHYNRPVYQKRDVKPVKTPVYNLRSRMIINDQSPSIFPVSKKQKKTATADKNSSLTNVKEEETVVGCTPNSSHNIGETNECVDCTAELSKRSDSGTPLNEILCQMCVSKLKGRDASATHNTRTVSSLQHLNKESSQINDSTDILHGKSNSQANNDLSQIRFKLSTVTESHSENFSMEPSVNGFSKEEGLISALNMNTDGVGGLNLRHGRTLRKRKSLATTMTAMKGKKREQELLKSKNKSEKATNQLKASPVFSQSSTSKSRYSRQNRLSLSVAKSGVRSKNKKRHTPTLLTNCSSKLIRDGEGLPSASEPVKRSRISKSKRKCWGEETSAKTYVFDSVPQTVVSEPESKRSSRELRTRVQVHHVLAVEERCCERPGTSKSEEVSDDKCNVDPKISVVSENELRVMRTTSSQPKKTDHSDVKGISSGSIPLTSQTNGLERHTKLFEDRNFRYPLRSRRSLKQNSSKTSDATQEAQMDSNKQQEDVSSDKSGEKILRTAEKTTSRNNIEVNSASQETTAKKVVKKNNKSTLSKNSGKQKSKKIKKSSRNTGNLRPAKTRNSSARSTENQFPVIARNSKSTKNLESINARNNSSRNNNKKRNSETKEQPEKTGSLTFTAGEEVLKQDRIKNKSSAKDQEIPKKKLKNSTNVLNSNSDRNVSVKVRNLRTRKSTLVSKTYSDAEKNEKLIVEEVTTEKKIDIAKASATVSSASEEEVISNLPEENKNINGSSHAIALNEEEKENSDCDEPDNLFQATIKDLGKNDVTNVKTPMRRKLRTTTAVLEGTHKRKSKEDIENTIRVDGDTSTRPKPFGETISNNDNFRKPPVHPLRKKSKSIFDSSRSTVSSYPPTNISRFLGESTKSYLAHKRFLFNSQKNSLRTPGREENRPLNSTVLDGGVRRENRKSFGANFSTIGQPRPLVTEISGIANERSNIRFLSRSNASVSHGISNKLTNFLTKFQSNSKTEAPSLKFKELK